MSFLRKFNFNKNILSLILTSFLSIIIFFSNESSSSDKIKGSFIDIYSVLSKPKLWYKDILLIKEENKFLSKKNVQLSLLNSKLINYEIENKRLRDMLEFKNESFKHLSLLPAKVINSNLSSSIESIIINVGSEDGISNNLAIIDYNGYLVGKIIDIGKKNSKVQLISDNNYSVSIKIGQNISIGQFKSTYGNLGILERIIKTSDISKDDIVYTSGISEIYPSDIAVARVTNTNKKKNKLFQDVAVEVLTDINRLYYVFVIQ